MTDANFESLGVIIWCDHSNENSSAVLLNGNFVFEYFAKWQVLFLG